MYTNHVKFNKILDNIHNSHVLWFQAIRKHERQAHRIQQLNSLVRLSVRKGVANMSKIDKTTRENILLVANQSKGLRNKLFTHARIHENNMTLQRVITISNLMGYKVGYDGYKNESSSIVNAHTKTRVWLKNDMMRDDKFKMTREFKTYTSNAFCRRSEALRKP